MYDPAPPLELEPAFRPIRPILPIERLAAGLEVFLCSGLPTQLFLLWVLHGFGIEVLRPDQTPSARGVFLISLIDTVLVCGLVVMLLRAHRESPRDVLIGTRPILREVGLGLVLIPLVFFLVGVVIITVRHYLPGLHNVPENPFESLMQGRMQTLIFAFVAMVAGGVREEVQRGFIIHRFDSYLGGGGVGVIVYGVAFGLFHYPQGWDASIATGCLGIAWGFVYLRRRSIIAPVVCHAGFNLAQIAKALAR